MDSRSGRKIALLAFLGAVLSFEASGADVLHEPSGITFPASIEGRFTRGAVKQHGRECTGTYVTQAGQEVVVIVLPATQGAKGVFRKKTSSCGTGGSTFPL